MHTDQHDADHMAAVLMALAKHPEVEGNAPSVRELAALVGLSMATIWRYLDLLRARRLVGLGRCTL